MDSRSFEKSHSWKQDLQEMSAHTSKISYQESQTVWEQGMAEKILRYVRDELGAEFHFFYALLSAFSYQPEERLGMMAEDGEVLFYPPEQILRLFEKNPKFLTRSYLHSVFHCLFSHLWIRGKRDKYVWGIACDIAVEYTIDSLEKECTKRILNLCRLTVYKKIREISDGISAARIYRWLCTQTPDELREIHQEFLTDDHVFWPEEETLTKHQMMLQAKWKKLGRQMELEKKSRGESPEEGEVLLNYQMNVQKRKRSYREFLKSFMILREEQKLDPDEFDLGFYVYGLSVYQNLPLIEPLESRESKKIRDFVIAIDTSYSTSGSLVQDFLKETFQIMTESNHFFSYARIHLIQADEKVQSEVLLTGEKEIERLFSGFEIKGGGGTDFRPVFQYVDRLLAEGVYKDLCGLLYFTDGKGIYPEKRPAYKTAFLFLEDYEEEKVPAWAIRMRVEKEDFGG